MQMNKTLLALAAALAVLGSPAAQAQSSKELDELRQEIKQLREELNALKKQKAPEAKPADASGWGERIEALEIKSKDAVVLGDIGGGFRLPGSETSIRLYGYAEAHAIHDFNRSSPSDNFTDLFETVGGTAFDDQFAPGGDSLAHSITFLGRDGNDYFRASARGSGWATAK